MLAKLDNAKRRYNNAASASALKDPGRYVKIRKESLRLIKTRLLASEQAKLGKAKQRYISLTARLDALSPLKVLTRGYSMVQTTDGEIITSVNRVKTNDRINIRFSDGHAAATIIETGDVCE